MSGISDSQFYMWRTIFAMAHADSIVTDEEVRMMAEALVDVPFSPEQRKILEQDIREPQDIIKMFSSISEQKDQARFFDFAREMVYADGDYGLDEQHMMLKLQEIHMQGVNVDNLVGSVSLEFEDTPRPAAAGPARKEKDMGGILASFKKLFGN